MKVLSQISACLATCVQITPLPPDSVSCLNPHTSTASAHKLLSIHRTGADYPKIAIIEF